jgi:FAD/FMN-containing dehydrogenase
MAPLVRGCIELGLTIIPRGGGTGYTGGAVPLTPLSAVINTEKLIDLGGVENDAARRRRPYATVRTGAGVVTRRVMEAAEKAGLVFACRPDLGRRLLHRRQHRDERRRQEGRAVGHGAGQPGLVAHGRPGRQLAGGRPPRPQPRQDPRQETGRFRSRFDDADGKPKLGEELLDHARRRFRKEGLGKDVTDKFLAGLPGVQKEGTDGLITSGALGAAQACRRSRAPSASNSSARCAKPCRPSSRSRLLQAGGAGNARRRATGRPGTPRRALRARRRLRHQGQAPRPAEDGADRRHRRRRRDGGDGRRLGSRALCQCPRRRRLHRRHAETRKKFWLDRARTAAIARTPTPSRSTRTW